MRKDSPYYLASINVLQSAALFQGVDEEMMEEILRYINQLRAKVKQSPIKV